MRPLKLLTPLILLLLLAPCVTGITELDYGPHDISINLQSGQDAAYLIPMRSGDRLVVDLTVTHGGNVDFYLTNRTAYNAYRTGHLHSLFYLGGQSCEDCSRLHYSYDSFTSDQYVLLVDNTASTESGAVPTGPVSVEGTITVQRNIWTLRNIIITGAVMVGIVLFMACLRWPRKKSGKR